MALSFRVEKVNNVDSEVQIEEPDKQSEEQREKNSGFDLLQQIFRNTALYVGAIVELLFLFILKIIILHLKVLLIIVFLKILEKK